MVAPLPLSMSGERGLPNRYQKEKNGSCTNHKPRRERFGSSSNGVRRSISPKSDSTVRYLLTLADEDNPARSAILFCLVAPDPMASITEL